MLTPKSIVEQMMAKDAMSQWLGIEIIDVTPGNVIISMVVKPEMLNGFEIAHGSITYALSDSCLAFSSNSHGQQSVSVETSISHLAPVFAGDKLTTSIEEISLTKRFGIYAVSIYNQDQKLVSTFKGTMYRKDKIWK